ncbi:CPBP family intramembrane glutamic endopeptidase [Synechococcus sp. PCC 6312]|uniref:CPBP family intramembrane glutamic endopeptidase n=1 Tax=Synechococcus sp. (strain ATCC 27167 / PCC 6312) TaxID=195253 RepID=UPI00029F3B2C|nr:CPBP family intramembrane glutamic endopeptidase [Synechococcus sp. PCC 6312]AFY60643.1 putative metal-dependent membrane protease [Synechococcus sp. PCC 6312]
MEPVSPQPELEPLSRTQILVAMGLTAILWLILSKALLQTPFAGGLLPLIWQPQALMVGTLIATGIVLASSLLYQFWPTYRAAADFYLELVIRPLVWADVFWLGLLPGLSEELLFRGVLLPTLGLDWYGIIGSAICFGILHMGGKQQWPYAIWATMVGGILGYSAVASGNLLVPVLAHTLTNWAAGVMWKLKHQP